MLYEFGGFESEMRGRKRPRHPYIESTDSLIAALISLCSLIQPYKQKIANVSAVATLLILSTCIRLGQHQTNLIRILITSLAFIPHIALGVYLLWKLNIFKVCYNKYKRLRCDETDGMVEMPP